MFYLDWMNDLWSYDRVTSNKKPYTIKKDKEKCVIVHEALGVSEEDITVEVVKEKAISYLVLKGASKNKITGDTYRFNSAFQIDENQIKAVKKMAKDGLLYIYIEYKEPEKPKFKVEDAEDLDTILSSISFNK